MRSQNENLKKIGKNTQFKRGAKQAEIARKAGIQSGIAKRERKTLKDSLLMLLQDETVQNSLVAALMKKAQKGDVKAFEAIRDTIGENPTSKVLQANAITRAVVVFDEQRQAVDITPEIATASENTAQLAELEKKSPISTGDDTPPPVA